MRCQCVRTGKVHPGKLVQNVTMEALYLGTVGLSHHLALLLHAAMPSIARFLAVVSK